MPDRVIASFESLEKDHCVDLFVRDDGTYGFEEWRREPEDPGKWYRARYYAAQVYAQPQQAFEEARRAVEWLSQLPIPELPVP
jgi:hypothetical protein